MYAREFVPVVRLLAAMTGRVDVAEELAQDVFVTTHNRWDEIRDYDRPEAWIRKIAVNRATSWLRRRSVEARLMMRLGGRPTPSAAVPESADATWRVVRALPRRQAQVIALVYLEDRDVADVAAILGCSVDTVRTHLRRGRLALSTRLGATVDDEPVGPLVRPRLAEEGR